MKMGKQEILTRVTLKKLRAAFFALIMIGAVFVGLLGNVSALIFFQDDMESGIGGWTFDGFWHQVDSGDPLAPFWNISHSPDHSWWYGQDATGNYDNGFTNTGNLTSPVIDLTLAAIGNLTFWTWYWTEGGTNYDQMWIQISEDAGPFIDEYQINPISPGTWLEMSINITSHVGHNIQIRFYFDTVDDVANDYQGWYIDDLEVNDIPLPPSPKFEPPHSDYGLDNDGNGLFNYLVVNVTVNITIAGDYIIEGMLFDPFGGWIDDDTIFTFLNTGVQIVELQFEGWLIRNSFQDGPYDVELYLYDDSWNLLDSDIHTTGPYTYDQFDFPPASFEPPHSDYGLDTDGDGYFNYLVVNVTVNVSVAGDYIIEGYLYDPMGPSIDDDINFTFLNVGIQTVQLWFDGKSIYTSSADGPYDVELILNDDSWNFLDFNFYTTNPYLYDQFQPPGAAFEPPYSDYGLDTDGDGYFNYLVVNVTVNVSVADAYRVEGWLYDSSMITIDFDSNYTFLNTGIQVIRLYFDGTSIYNWGVDGPYEVELELTDSLWNLLDTDWYTTNSYIYDQFQPPGAAFQPPYSDYGLDTDSDGYFNYLVVNVTVNVSVAGDYIIEGYLHDPMGPWIDSDTNFTFLNAGIQTVQLWFEGTSIYVNGADGGYDVELYLYDDSWNILDTDWYTTSFYTYDQFQPPSAVFSPPYSDYGLDTDSDGYFNYLVVNVTVNVGAAGDYIIEGYLYDPMGPWIDSDTNFTFLNAGTQTVQLWFDGLSIYTSGADGGYDVELYLYDDLWNILDTDWYTTSFYTYDQFQPPSAAFQPPYSDYGLDTDGDGYFNYLVVNVSVNIGIADFYEVYGDLWGPMNWIEGYSNYTFFNTGVQVVQLYFDGSSIYTNAENGTYTVYLELYDDIGSWLDSDMYTTNFYTYDQFQPPAAAFSPPYSDYGLDTDGDGFFNYLVVNVTVDVNIAGDYTVQAVLLDSTPAFIEFIDNTTFLNTGVQVVQFYFSGPAIYSHGIDGPYMVLLELFDNMNNSLDTDMYTTNFYTFSQFQAGGAAFNPPHSDNGLDTDGDGYFNYLVVSVSVNVIVAGDYTVEGTLFDPLFNPIDFNFNFTFLNTGIQVVQLYFDGMTIFNNGEDGTFSVYLELFDNLSAMIDADIYTTTFYSHIQFQRPASLQPPYSDYGLDTDGDGYFNYLVVNVTVNVSMAGDYEVFGELYNASMVVIGSDSNLTTFNTGLQVVQLYFDGMSIYNNGENGTYTVWLDLYDDSMNWLDSDMYITSIYTYDQFQPPPVNPWATATGPVSFGTNNPSPTITYNYGNSPTNVQIYWSNDGGLSWNMWGTDNTVDGSWPAGSPLPASGTYYWSARAMGGPSEPIPSGPADIETGPYVLDIDPPTIQSTTPLDEAIGVSTAAGTYVIEFSEPMDIIGTPSTDLPGIVWTWDPSGLWLNGTYTALSPSTMYYVDLTGLGFQDLVGNGLTGDTYKNFTTAAAANPWATATGPISVLTNDPNPTITYTYGNAPTSVEIYWSDDGGATWNLWGTDASVDGSWPAGSPLPASGTYDWSARAMGITNEAVPSGPGDIEAGSYVLDIDAPSIQSTTPTDSATGVSTVAGIYVIEFTEPMNPVGTPLTDLPGIVWTWDPSGLWLNGTYTTLNPSTTYNVNLTGLGFQDLATNALTGDTEKNFTTAAAPGPWAIATGPMSVLTNNPSPTITYTFGNGPTSVEIYWSDDGGASWNLWGTDASVDGSWPAAGPLPASGTYVWSARAMGITNETIPSGPGDVEASSYVLDIDVPTILSTTPLDDAVGISTAAGTYVIEFSEPMDIIGTPSTDLPGIVWTWDPSGLWLNGTYTALSPSTTYYVDLTGLGFQDMAGNGLAGDTYKNFTTAAAVNPWATATGPISVLTNDPNPTITYTYGNAPTSVEIYWSDDGGASWNLWGTDATVDGSWPAGSSLPASGTYDWSARAIGATNESVPSGPGDIEAGSYVLDIDAPSIQSTTPPDGATGISTAAGTYVIEFTEPMSLVGTPLNDLPGIIWTWDPSGLWLNGTYTALIPSTTYNVNLTGLGFQDLATNALTGDMVKNFTTAAAPGPWAVVTGPIAGLTNNSSPTITYNFGNGPTSVEIYWSDDSGATWNLWGTDMSVDGSWPAASALSASGTYDWCARAIGVTNESVPTGPGDIESGPYNLDIDAPTISSTTPSDGASGIGIAAGTYVIKFSEPMTAIGTPVSDLPGVSWTWDGSGLWLNGTYTALTYSTTYYVDLTGLGIQDLAGNALTGDMYKDFTTQPPPDNTPPTSSVGAIDPYQTTLTFNIPWTASDPSGILYVELYYTTDGGTSWYKFGTTFIFSPISFTAPDDGEYGFYVIATDNSPLQNRETPPSSGTPPDRTTTVDTTPPTVDAGPDLTENSEFTQDASASDDTSGIATYEWTKVSGPGTITFGDDAAEDTTVSADTDGTYVISLTVTDLAGNSDYDEFTLVWDTTSPTVTTATPTGTEVSVTSTITITFNEAMNHASVQNAFNFTDGTTVWTIANGSVSWAGNVMTFTPTTDLSYGTSYTVNIGTGAQDQVGNGLATVYTWSFTTAQAPDTTAPTVSSVSLTGTKVEVTNKLSITFDEPMDHASVEDAITISPEVEIINYSWVGNTLTITFESDLEHGTNYTVTIGTGAEDEAGNALGEYSWSFTTKEKEEEAEFPVWIIALIVIIIIVILLILFLMKGKRKPEGLPEEKAAEAEVEEKPEEELVEEAGITEGEGLEEKAEEEIGTETGEGEVEKPLEEMAEEEKKESEEL